MSDRRLVRGGCAPFAIEIVLQDGGDGAIGVRTDLQRAPTGRLEPLAPVCLEVPQDADAGAKALLGVGPLAQDDVDERRCTWADLTRLPLDALQRPVGETPMARRHMLGQRAMFPTIEGNARVRGYTLAVMEHLDGLFRVARRHLLAQHGMRHRVEVGLYLDVVVDPDAALLPLREGIGLGRKRLECLPLDLFEQCAAARAEVPRHTVVELHNEFTDCLVECKQGEERTITELGDNPSGCDLYSDLYFRLFSGAPGQSPCRSASPYPHT